MNRIDRKDLRYMLQALDQAQLAMDAGETPVGALVVCDDEVLGCGRNLMETLKDPTAHAEMVALQEAARNRGDWRLLHATVYVTLEPCIMCAGALVHARVKRVVYGARDNRWGGLGSLFDLSNDPRINHSIEVVPGVMERESAEILRRFFERLREDNTRGQKHPVQRRDAREAEGG